MDPPDDKTIKPSGLCDDWTGTQRIHPTVAQVVKTFVSGLNFQALLDHANSLRHRTDCKIDGEHFQCGKDHVVFALHFDDGVFWIARTPIPSATNFTIGIEETKSEIATIQFIGMHSTIPVPKIYGYNLDESNPFGAPYVLFEALPGRVLNSLPMVDENSKVLVYRQVASLMIQIAQLPSWSQIGLIQEYSSNAAFPISNIGFPIPNLPKQPAQSSARSYFDLRAERFLEFTLAKGNRDKIAVAWLYRQAIPYFVSEIFNDHTFPLCHADFSNCNILFVDDYNIAGIIDWTWAQSGPWELFACFPHEFSRIFYPEKSLDKASRQLFLEILEEEEQKQDLNVPLARYMGSKAGRILEITQDYQSMSHGEWLPMENIHELIELLYGDSHTWEDIKKLAWAQLGISSITNRESTSIEILQPHVLT